MAKKINDQAQNITAFKSTTKIKKVKKQTEKYCDMQYEFRQSILYYKTNSRENMKGKRDSKEHLTKSNKNSSLQTEMVHPGSSRMDKDPHFSETPELGLLRKF